MKIQTRLILILAAVLPLSLSAAPTGKHARLNRPNCSQPVTVPDTASTVLLLATGLGALGLLKHKSSTRPSADPRT